MFTFQVSDSAPGKDAYAGSKIHVGQLPFSRDVLQRKKAISALCLEMEQYGQDFGKVRRKYSFILKSTQTRKISLFYQLGICEDSSRSRALLGKVGDTRGRDMNSVLALETGSFKVPHFY